MTFPVFSARFRTSSPSRVVYDLDYQTHSKLQPFIVFIQLRMKD